MQLATERRLRRELEEKLSVKEQLNAQLVQSLMAEQEEKQDLVERRQRADDDYVAAQEKLGKAAEDYAELQRKLRNVKDEARERVDKGRGLKLDGMTVEELETLEHEQEDALARVRAAKMKRQQIELEKVKRDLEEVRERRLCVVCRDEDIEVVIVPCGHACLCQECAGAVKLSASALCPMCREPIDDVARIHVG